MTDPDDLIDIIRQLVYNHNNRLLKVANGECEATIKKATDILVRHDIEQEYKEK